jgi:hypothetical protein
MNMQVNTGNTKYSSWEFFLLSAAEKISLSEAQYQIINNRYQQLQKVLDAADDPLLAQAHIFVQGSMRLRTTIKPVADAPKDLGTIDADAIVWLPHAQGASAMQVLDAIYQRFNDGSRVQAKIELLRRGVRIVYADENPGFHIDVTPARAIAGNGQENGAGKLEVPDRELQGWKASSPLPYATWLQTASQEQIALDSTHRLAKRDGRLVEASQEPLPDYALYSEQDPLRAAVKMLKRHRDEWAIRTGTEGHRPISAVITTLASQAYLDVAKASKARALRPLEAMMAIVQRMPAYIQGHPGHYQVCNPKDPGENFAEKWNRPDGQLYRQAFDRWHAHAMSSFALGLQTFSSTAAFADSVKESFGIGGAFVNEINEAIPPNWTLPGRAYTVTRNATVAGAFFGEGVRGQGAQENVKPVGRLG